jgi:disulfide oxidoreductase YuzD
MEENQLENIICQVEEHEIYSVAQRTHREPDDFCDGDLGHRLEEYKYYNLIKDFEISTLDLNEWEVCDDMVEDYMELIQKEGVDNMPPIVVSEDDSIIDGIHRLNALSRLGIDNFDIFVGTSHKLDLEIKNNVIKTGIKQKRNKLQP